MTITVLIRSDVTDVQTARRVFVTGFLAGTWRAGPSEATPIVGADVRPIAALHSIAEQVIAAIIVVLAKLRWIAVSIPIPIPVSVSVGRGLVLTTD